MITRCTSRSFAIIAGAILAFAAIFTLGGSSASAVCPNVTVTNNTACNVTLYFLCPGTTAIGPIVVGPGAVVVVPMPAGCTPQAVPIICGNRRVLPGGCFNNVSVAPGCCATVCYNPAACTVVFNPTPGPCPC